MTVLVKRVLLGVTVVCAFLLSLATGYFYGTSKQKDESQKVQIQMKSEIDSLKHVISAVEQQSRNVEYRRDLLLRKLEASEQDLKRIEDKYNDKINNTVGYTNLELERFFYNRYSSN